MAGRATYTEADKARVFVALEANGHNIKRTSRQENIPESTVRRWKEEWAEGINLPEVDAVSAATDDFVVRAEEVRDEALAMLRSKLRDARVGELNAVVGTLTDKLASARGLPTSRTEHTLTLPSPEELREALEPAVQRAIEAASNRQEEIVDAEVIEVAETHLLPSPRLPA